MVGPPMALTPLRTSTPAPLRASLIAGNENDGRRTLADMTGEEDGETYEEDDAAPGLDDTGGE